MLKFKPDYEQTKQRIEAFWERELIDRPVVQFSMAKPPEAWVDLPTAHHATPAERWLDVEYQAEWHLAHLSNQEFLGDSLPIAWPNLGPEIFSAFYGCPMHFGNYGTSWSDPILHDWDDVDSLQMDWENVYLKKLHDMTDAFLDIGKDKFITGMTDWHPGGDCLAAFRDPQNLAMDMILHLNEVKTLLDRVEADYFKVYDIFYKKLRAAGQPITSWINLICEGKYYIPSNDFSIMISEAMFNDVFLPGIRRECQFLDRSIYHLDGPGAIRHLDALLDIPELDAIQYVPGASNEGFHKWIDLYQRIQAADKGMQVLCHFEEINLIMETLNPRGVFLSVGGVPSREAGEAMLHKLECWCVQKA